MSPAGFGDMGSILRQAQKMQKQIQKLQEELKERVVEGSAGGGVVKAMVNGAMELLAVKIDPEAVDPSDVGLLEDMILAAVNQALKQASQMKEQELGRVYGGLGMPGLGL